MNHFLALLIALTISFFPCASSAYQWHRVPLTTVGQKSRAVNGGEGMQQIMCFAYSPQDSEVVYLGSDTSGVWKSIDGGASWRPCSKGFKAFGAVSIDVNSNDPNYLIAAGSTVGPQEVYDDRQKSDQGLYVSRDGGLSWDLRQHFEFYKTDSRGQIVKFIKGSEPDSILVAPASGGLFLSKDGGADWVQLVTGAVFLDIEEYGGGYLLATRDSLHYYDGDRVRLVFKAGFEVKSISVSNADTVFIAAGSGGVYRLTSNYSLKRQVFSIPGVSINDVYVSPVDGNIVYAVDHLSSLGPFFSTDGGLKWQQSECIDCDRVSNLPGRGYFSAPIAPHPSKAGEALYSPNGGASVFKTDNYGKNWKYSGSGYTGGFAKCLNKINGVFYLGLTDHGLWSSSDNLETFKQVAVKPYKGLHNCQSISGHGSDLIATVGTWSEQVVEISRDAGDSWVQVAALQATYKDRIIPVDISRGVYGLGRYLIDIWSLTWQKLPVKIVCCNGVQLYALDDMTNALVVSEYPDIRWNLQVKLPFKVGVINNVVLCGKDKILFATSMGVYIYDIVAKAWIETSKLNKNIVDRFGNNNISDVVYDGNGHVLLAKTSYGFGRSNGCFLMTFEKESISVKNVLTDVNVNTLYHDSDSATVYAGTVFGTMSIGLGDLLQ